MKHTYRTNNIRNAPIIKLLSEVKLPSDIISLGQGIPFFRPPTQSIQAIQEYVCHPKGYQYSPDAGFFDLRNIVVEKLKKENKIEANPNDNIIITAGANQGFMNALLTITNPGDEIILFSPTYFNYVMGIKLAGCKPVIIPTYHSKYMPEINKLQDAITSKTKALITISPNNPTGQVYPKRVLQQINEICKDHQLYHISDEVYEYFIYEKQSHISPCIFDEDIQHTITLYSCSKSFGMSGYRVGFMVIPSHLYNEVLKVQDTIGIAAPSLSQIGAVQALPIGQLYIKQFIDEINSIRLLFYETLKKEKKIHIVQPNGAMYFFIHLQTEKKSWDLSKKLIESYKVITIPGDVFDVPYPSLRVSFGNLNKKESSIGLDRLINGLENLL